MIILKKSFNLLSFNNNYIINISSSITLRQTFFSTVVIYFCHNFNLNITFILMSYCEDL